MKTKAFWAGLCLLMLTLSACGPMIGGMMVAGNGVKDFKVLQGDLSNLPSGSRVAVLGPFDKTPEAFYICRGEEAAAFSSAFNQSGLFSAELDVKTRFPEELPQASQFKGQTQAEVQKALGLQQSPDLIMSGTILSREMVAAPAQGVIMTVAYRLEFLNLGNGRTTVIEVAIKEMFQDVIPETVEYLVKQMGGR
jgi:hypothetical protein